MKQVVFFVVLMIIWLFLTWSLEIQQLIAGAVSSLILTLLLSRVYSDVPARAFNPLRWLWFILYTIEFIYYCIKANLDVAYRVLHPDLPIRPAIIKVHTNLRTDIARTFLANSITLTPGTLTVDIMEDGDMYIHWINVVTEDPEEQTDIIVKRFETILRRVFE
ncbi:MAG: Na+/H+ antiporter subunit E [Sedimentisphaerales bacterium]|nr:Na+/H+ antiporter subunit E [Sedimentisphaerales bacterium]